MKKIVSFFILSYIFFVNSTFADGGVIKDIILKHTGDNTTINGVIIENNITYSIDKTGIIKDKVIKDNNGNYYLNDKKLNGEEVIFLDDGGIILDKNNIKEGEKYYIKYNGEKVFEGNLEEYKKFKKDNFVILNNGKPLTESVGNKSPNFYQYFLDKDGNAFKFALKFNNFYFLGIENDLIYDVLCKDNNLVLSYKGKELIELIGSKEIVFMRLNNLYGIRPNISLMVDGENIQLNKEDDININGCTFHYNGLGKKYNMEVKNSNILSTSLNKNNVSKTEKSLSNSNMNTKTQYLKQFIISKNSLKKSFDEKIINGLDKQLNTVKEKIKEENTQKQKNIVERLYKGIDIMNNKFKDQKGQTFIEYIKSYFELHFFDL